MLTKTPLFSVIIPTYNRSNMVLPTIQSFIKQSFIDFELIIVDDGSNDDTSIIVNSIQDYRIKYHYKNNGERGAARNYGANLATGQYLNFFDSDDLAYNNHLSNAFRYIESTNFPDIFHVGYRIVDRENKTILEETNFNYQVNDRLIITNFLGCNSVFIKKDIFKDNMFNENRILASSEDWELWLRLASRHKILSCNTITFQINNHENRSLLTIEPSKIYERDMLLINLLMKDEPFLKTFHDKIAMFKADRFTFFALVFALTKKSRLKTITFIIKAFCIYKFVIFRRRFWASLKHLI